MFSGCFRLDVLVLFSGFLSHHMLATRVLVVREMLFVNVSLIGVELCGNRGQKLLGPVCEL